MGRYLNQHEVCSTYRAMSNDVHELLLVSSHYQANSDICSESKLHTGNYKSHTLFHQVIN